MSNEDIITIPSFEGNLSKKIILIVGQRQSGKTTLIQNLVPTIKKDGDILRSYLFSDNEQNTIKYKNLGVIDWEPKCLTHDDFAVPINSVLIFEDIMNPRTFLDKKFRSMVLTARHQNNTIIIAVQSIYDVPPFIRENTNHLFISNANPKLYETIAKTNIFSSYEEFKCCTDMLTSNYGFMILSLHGEHPLSIESAVTFYKVPTKLDKKKKLERIMEQLREMNLSNGKLDQAIKLLMDVHKEL